MLDLEGTGERQRFDRGKACSDELLPPARRKVLRRAGRWVACPLLLKQRLVLEAQFHPKPDDRSLIVVVGQVVWSDASDNHPVVQPSSSLMNQATPATLLSKLQYLGPTTTRGRRTAGVGAAVCGFCSWEHAPQSAISVIAMNGTKRRYKIMTLPFPPPP